MKRKKGWIAGIVVIAVIVLFFVGYNMYRYPAMFRGLSDNSLNDSQAEELREEILSQSDAKVLVAYFSYSGTTKNVAAALSEKTGGDLFEITPQEGYSNVYMESNSEIRRNERPTLTDTVENMEEYDIVFVGYPVWWHATPAPVNTFLESYDLTGKLIIPFCTSGGTNSPGCDWRKGYSGVLLYCVCTEENHDRPHSGDIQGNHAMQEAYRMGKDIC